MDSAQIMGSIEYVVLVTSLTGVYVSPGGFKDLGLK